MSASYRQRLSVLFVDDDREVLECFALYLETAGLDVMKVDNARDAIVAAAGCLPNLIVLDVAMPNIDGRSVLNALQAKATTAQIPVVLFSGLMPAKLPKSPQIRACVQKPCAPSDLLGVVRMYGGRA